MQNAGLYLCGAAGEGFLAFFLGSAAVGADVA